MKQAYHKPGYTRFLLAILALLLVTSSIADTAPERRYVRLTILHTNDTHSHLLPFNYPSVVIVEGETINLPVHKNVGGIARRAALINRIRAEREPGVLVLDAGDVIDGSPFSIEFAGEADVAAMNAAGYEVMVTGNHEYSNSLKDFLKRNQEARFPVLGANVLRSDGTPFLTPYVIITEDGLRVAILGLVDPNNYQAVREGALVIKDPVAVAREWVPKLREQADAVILLTHIGHKEDKRLAERVPGIDAIVGGHSHTRVEIPVLVKRDERPNAFWVGGTVVAQDFQWGTDLGCLDLIFRKGDWGWTLMSYGGRLITVTSDIPEDPSVRAVVEKYHEKIAPKYDVVLCQATADFLQEAAANLVSDALRETYDGEFAVHNYGGVRTDLVQGPITAGDIANLFPFGNTTMTFQAAGDQINEILRVHRPAVSNIRYRVEGDKLVFAELGGHPIEADRVYKGVTHSFFASNCFPKEINTTDTGLTTRDVIVEYVKGKKTISPDNERRAHFPR